MSVGLHGRFMRSDRSEHDCVIDEMSPGNAHFKSRVLCRPGEKIIAYMDQIGRIEGIVSRDTSDGFAIELAASERKREKLAAQLTWLINRSQLGLEEDRRHERLTPRNSATTIELDDGTSLPCSIVDMSFSGVALSMRTKPPMGARVLVGSIRGKVVRHFEDGVAIEFATLQTRESLNAAFASYAA